MVRSDYFLQTEYIPDKRSRWVFRLLMIAVTLIFIGGMVLLALADQRRTAARAHQQLRHFAELFEQSLEASLAVANLEMWSLIDDISYLPFRYADNIDAHYGRRLQRAVEEIEQVDSLVLLDNSGTVLWSTAASLVGMNLGDRAYFQTAVTLARDAFTVGVPITSRGSGRRVTPIAWPVLSSSGELRGVIASSLGEDYYASLLSLQEVAPDMRVRIVTANGETAFANRQTAEGGSGAQMMASRALPGLGLEIHVSRDRAAVMRGYWERTIAFGIIALALFFTVLMSAIRARRHSVLLAEGLKRSERDRLQIKSAQREFDAIFENVGDGIVIFDDTGTLRRSNLVARRFLGARDDDTAVRRLRDRIPPLPVIPEGTATFRLDLPPGEGEDERQAVQCRVKKLKLYGAEIAYCMLEDISAQERLAEARMAFVTSVNHELRTPLTSLSGALDLLGDRFGDTLPQGAAKLVSMASRNTERLLVLVNDILTLQAIDQQQLSIAREPVRVGQALTEASATNAGYGLSRDVTIRVNPLPDHEDPVLMLDPVRLQQILANLISNAIKYSPPGGVVNLGADVTDKAVSLYVTDTGPGIPQAALDRLFDRFTKPIHGRDVQASGTGLGLAITRELVQRQGGEITIETRAQADGACDSGTTFRIRFDRGTSEAEKDP
ncbi:sensory box histidine kinase [Pseudooceanicola batsensis HTCC2597]|uniref:histidine kinase n=1 Tax=Pseudooceanicola batsensis (strain ATCC BAA-863 / DSM 15984 / KCTC 12145 / HTCC2597) TaxID=252305 RepID=A3U0W3_PSEBH|nr:ATP-binding protein [Pseudooceanicola batsensis]EAQ02404.1 sensory box histidine kinase [Pseudooceanicola batsensis HTCC2597]